LVKLISAWLGFRFPDGWLCAKTIALAHAYNAVPKISLGSAIVPDTPPEETSNNPITLFPLFNNNTLNCSNNSIVSGFQVSEKTLNTSLEELSFGLSEFLIFEL
jgi:hypothetical protein